MKRILLAALLLTSPSLAQPLRQQGQNGRYYELKASCPGVAGQSWLGGQLQPARDPWAPAVSSDAFLACLRKDGALQWEKVFGSRQGSESIEQLATDPTGGVYAAGQLACDLEQAWKGETPVDYSRNAYLAHIDPQGKLLNWLDLRIQPLDSNTEPELKSHALCATSEHVYLGLSFQGRLGPLQSSRQNAAALLVCDLMLASPQYYTAPAQDIGAIAQINGKLYAAGRTDISPGSQGGPNISRPILWEMTDPQRPQPLWRGQPAENIEIQQLGSQGLLFTDNATPQTQRLDLQSLQIEKLPPGILQLAGSMALGYSNGQLPETQSIGGCDLVLWTRRQHNWQPLARLGSSDRDFPGALFETPEGFVATATIQGRLPGQAPPLEQSQNWLWFRFSPGDNLASLGQRQPGELRRQLSTALENLVYREEPDYQHMVGFLEDEVISTTPGRLYDSWRRQDLTGQLLQEWHPDLPSDAPPPLEPQIFPRLNGSTLFCLNPPRRTAWFRDGKTGFLDNLDCQACWNSSYLGIQYKPKQQRLLIGNLETGWKSPLGSWLEGAKALALSAGPQGGLCAIWEDNRVPKVSTYSSSGEPLKTFPLPGRQFQAALGRPDGLWVASDDRLHHLDWNGKSLGATPLNGMRVARIKLVGSEVWLLGSRREPATGVDQASWMASGKMPHSLPLDRNSVCLDARATVEGTWIAGEVEDDYITDVFWGKIPPGLK